MIWARFGPNVGGARQRLWGAPPKAFGSSQEFPGTAPDPGGSAPDSGTAPDTPSTPAWGTAPGILRWTVMDGDAW